MKIARILWHGVLFWLGCAAFELTCTAQPQRVADFNDNWKFWLGDDSMACQPNYPDENWRNLHLPHDWSIEANFSNGYPATNQGGALPGGIGWYRKTFTVPTSHHQYLTRIAFDGVYKNSEVWINGHYLGKRPNGYVNFVYNLTGYLNYGQPNVVCVRVDNSEQPDSRWYTGSGIYRDVKLLTTPNIYLDESSAYVHTPQVNDKQATVKATIKLHGVQQKNTALRVGFAVISAAGKIVEQQWMQAVDHDQFGVQVSLTNPLLWSPLAPNLYKARFRLYLADKLVDEYSLSFGIRTFRFDRVAGFFINNKPLKIQGVCMHHDLGALGAAFHPDAAMRQLQILKQMGCNAIRFAHNPPATPLLDMCDELGFLVVDEAFDMWKKRKTKFDYHQYFDQWHVPDLRAMVLRDRNHPSIIMWSIGNEIREQFDSTGITIAKRLAALVKELDTTRPVTSALTEMIPEKNFITQSGSLDVLSFNYKEYDYAALPARFPDAAFVASETASALASRGVYVNGTDSMLIWPASFREQDSFNKGYTDYTCNAYDNTAAYWGTTHQRAWLAVKRYPFISGAFVWSGFDYLGEPLPYLFPARSSYFGIIDLAGFPKDVYYMYQAEWTTKPVLHLLPHWNWQIGDTVNVWAYYSQADEVELFLNGKSLGAQQKSDTSLHVRWRVPYAPGVLLAVSKKEGRPVMKTQVETTDKLAQVLLAASINKPSLQRRPLSFVTIQLADALGRAISHTDVMVKVQIASNSARLLGLDNGYQADTTSLQSPLRQTFKGKLLAIIEHTNHKQPVVLKVQAQGLPAKTITLPARHTME